MFRITETQTGMFLEWQANRSSLQYNITGAARLPVTVDLDRLERAVRETVAAHPVFRTRFVERDGEIRQDFDSTAEIPFVRQSFGTEDEAQAFLKGLAKPFDLLGGELARFAFLSVPTANFFAFDISHLIFDGSSWAAFYDEVGDRYAGRSVTDEGATYAEFAAAEEASFASADYAAAAADHKARFADVAMTVPDDPAAEGTASVRSPVLIESVTKIDKTLVDDCCRKLGVTPNLFFMGVFARVLCTYSHERKVAFLTVNHGRRDPAFRRTIGACIKTVPVLGELKADQPLGDYLKGFRLHRAGVYPFTHAARDLGLKPGFMFVFQDGTTDLSMTLDGATYPIRTFAGDGASELPAVQLYGDTQGDAPQYACLVSCLPGRYSQAFLDGLAALFASTARNFAAQPEARLGEIPTLDDAAQTGLLDLSRGKAMPVDADSTFVGLVAAHAVRTPERTAVVDCEGSITYGELDARSTALAALLAEKGVRSGGFVGLMLPRRLSFVVSLLAVQKCGAGYVPIDAEYPADRIAYMLADSEAPVLVTTKALLAGKNLAFKGRIVFIEEELAAAPSWCGETPHLRPSWCGETPHLRPSWCGETPHLRGGGVLASPDGRGFASASEEIEPADHQTSQTTQTCQTYQTFPTSLSPAYMIYTSGSTGKPKGVVVSQRALCAMCAWVPKEYGITADSRIATHPSFSFDASVIDLFPALASGAELHIFSEEIRKDLAALRDYIVDHGITGGTMSTQMGMALIDTYPDLPLKYIQLGGEKLLPTAKTSIRIINGYGPTEFTVCSSFQVVDQSAEGEIPIGRPVPNTSSFICDPLGQLVPQGLTGELCLAGPQLADGYWHNPEKTAAAFVAIPFEGESRSSVNTGQKTEDKGLQPFLYRTGDLARYNEKGLLEYRGRIDFQVKLRGFRIEIGEIEHAAAACDGVEATIALVREIAGAQHLVLYYTGTADQAAVRTKMSETLTGYMVPDFFVRLEKMPMTPVGKIDRKALPLPELSDEPIEEPANETESAVLDIVRTVLKTDRVGVTHDFNRLGLTSLGAMSLIAQVRAKAGVKVTMRQLVEHPTVRSLVGSVKAQGGDALPAGPVAVSRRPKRKTYPMTENQRGVYADWLREPTALQYNVPVAIRFPNRDAAQLAAAVERVLDAHPAFKTRFVEKDGEIVQERRDEAKIPVAVETAEGPLDAAFFAARMRPFAPQGDDLTRATVFASPTDAYLFLDAHHTVFDGISVGVFLADLVRVLEGGEPKGEAATAFDVALDERDYLESDLLAEDDAWFANYLDGSESTSLELGSGADGQPGQCARVTVRTGAAAISKRCSELAVSASDWFLTAFMELLRRIGRSDDVQVAFVSAGRADPDLADTVGMFVRTLPVRNVKDAKTFSETVRRTRNDVRDLLDRDRYSYARAAERLGLRPEIIFAFEGGLFDLPLGAELLSPTLGTVKCPLSVLVTPGRDDFELAFEYDASLYDARDMRLLLGLFENLSQKAACVDELRAIPLVADETVASLVRLSSGEPLDYDASKTFVDLFRAAAIARPFATAVVDCEDSIAYGELDVRSTALAALLAEKGVRSGGFAGLMLPRRLSFVVSLLAVQKCGAGYVPIDAEYPADRIAYMLADSEAPVLVTTKALLAGKSLDFKGQIVFIEEELAAAPSWCGETPHLRPSWCGETPHLRPSWCGETPHLRGGGVLASPDGRGFASASEEIEPPDHQTSQTFQTSQTSQTCQTFPTSLSPAYMIYTSGSTGKPKGVVVSQRALRHLCAWVPKVYGVSYESRIATHPSFSFDASVIDIFPALSAGAELHIFAEGIRKDLPAMRDYVVEHGITGLTMSTQIGMALIDAFPDLPLKYIQLGGEKLLPTAKTAIRIINGYGPTEFTVCSSAHVVDQSEAGDIPIGRAVPGTASYIVDRYGHLLPQGFSGEIALAGPQLADGYWHNPEKTAAAFVAIPFEVEPRSLVNTGQKTEDKGLQPALYRTGDLARYDAKGRLEYLGRIDFQVKLRGFRIEIGEIEHAAAQFPGVGAVAAEVREVGGTKHLVLYYSGEGTVDEAALKESMSAALASYMVPDYFVRLETVPMTPNGKINRRALPAPSGEAAEETFVEPSPGAEADIAAVYAEILKLDRFGATADFFRSGGTSLLGIKAVVALQKRAIDVQYGDLFKYKTPRALAAFLSGAPQPSASGLRPSAFAYAAYDYAKIDAFLRGTRTELFDGFKVHSLGDVLLTGATGYLGIHVLRHLLERTSSSVVALIRAKHGTSPERRLDSAYVYYFGERLPRALRDRVTFVEGDITDADLGAKLADVSVNTVINCAALVKHYVSDDAMDRINVGGVENLIRYCEGVKARLVQTSTYSVGGTVGASSPAVLDERALFVGQDSDNDYVRTKFLSERAVLEAVAAGTLRGKVMRLGNLMGRESDGEFQMNVGANAFVNSLKSYKAIGAFPLEELATRIEMSPIDRVAEAICLLATTPDDMAVFHPFNVYALDMGAVLGAMNRCGYDVDWVSRSEFAARVDALRNDPQHADELQGILHYAQRHLKDEKVTPVANAWTATVLYRLGFRWKPAEDGYLARFFEMLDGLAVFG